ncbi:MAG: DUF1353 domain-containing protein [Calditrichaceae bacterium]|nr:DUF1353 domain-containing protein [Calditrichia bacterium]NUQ41931.1 DUF1353 domain-containing protein [Calditrichaceae bacterium]
MKPFLETLKKTLVKIPASDLPSPVITYLVAEKCWRLEGPYELPAGAVLPRDPQTALKIPAGFKFDLASIPRPLWWLIAPFELSIAAPLVHDFLYRSGGNPPQDSVTPPRSYTRKETDQIFKHLMKGERVKPWRMNSAYLAVRWFGGKAWKD